MSDSERMPTCVRCGHMMLFRDMTVCFTCQYQDYMAQQEESNSEPDQPRIMAQLRASLGLEEK